MVLTACRNLLKPWSPISTSPTNARRLPPYSIHCSNVTAPQNQHDRRRDQTLPLNKAVLVTDPLLWPAQTRDHVEEDSRATYTNTPPANTRKSPSVIQHSLSLPVRRWGTLGSAPGHHPHRWHCTGSRAATGSTFLQIQKLTAMRNMSASLPLKTQLFVISYLRKPSINNQTMHTATPKKSKQHQGPVLLLISLGQCSQCWFFFFPFFHSSENKAKQRSVNRGWQDLPGTTANGN